MRLSEGDEATRQWLTDLKELNPKIYESNTPIVEATAAGDYTKALTEIAALRPVVDRFFTEVFVMADDARVRTARLTLMANLRDLVLDLADISEIVPHTE